MLTPNLEKQETVERVQQIVEALKSSATTEEDRTLWQAWLNQILDFQNHSYFLGIHPSWLQSLVSQESPAIQEALRNRHPVLMEVLKRKLKRLPQQENLLSSGQRWLVSYLLQVGKNRTAELLAKQPELIQNAIIEALTLHHPLESTELELDFFFELQYPTPDDLFKSVGFYGNHPEQVVELAQRLEYAQGQKLIRLLSPKKSG
ncbi:MAG: hypothetical protein I8H75_04185 [Myxococcaceae bacterium]|nr:hypothetical protein [Myxococcaceae bacterium]